MSTFIFRNFLVYILVICINVAGFSRGSRAPIESEMIPNDPTVRYGILANGLTYYVQANAKPVGIAELRLAVRAGSVLEDEDQLGLAHFLEHMLFNGTQKYPENQLVDMLESFGIAFGPDINAYTSFEETTFTLSVKSDDAEQFQTGLDILKEWAFNATLDTHEFEKERNVVYEEWRVGRGAQARIRDQHYPVLFHDSRYAERRPIGDMNIVLEAPVEALKRFYTDWYRPDMMAIIAVGDFDPDTVVNHINEKFSYQKNPLNPRPRTEYSMPKHTETLINVAHDPEATQSSVQVYVKYDAPNIIYQRELLRSFSEQLFYTMLNQRLDEIGRRENAPFLHAFGSSNIYSKNIALSGLYAGVPEDAALKGLEAILIETERVKQHGFLPIELERAKTNYMSLFENYWKQRNDIPSANLVDQFLDAFYDGKTYPSIDWEWQTLQEMIPLITMDDVTTESERLLNDSNRVILISGPSVPAITHIEEQDIRQILDSIQSQELEPWVDTSLVGPLIDDIPEPGHIVARTTIPGTDIVSLTLSNGARVLYKVTAFKKDEILFRAMSSGGASLVEDAQYISAQFAVDAVQEGGLGKYSVDALRKILTGKNVEISPFIQEFAEGMSGQSTPEDLETLFHLIYLHHKAPRLDETSWKVLMNRMYEELRNRESNPMTLYDDDLWKTIYGEHFRARPITLERLSEANLNDALAIYTDRFKQGGDFTYVFVGDIDVEVLEKLVVQWLAPLPSAEFNERGKDRGLRNAEGRWERSIEAGSEPLSIVTQAWLGYWDGSFTERYRIQSLASALEMKLTKTIREEYGGTYSIGVYPHIATVPIPDYRFIVRYSCNPQRVDELTSRVEEIIQEWKSSPPEKKFSEDINANQKRSLNENLKRNDWWMGQIFFSLITGTPPKDMMHRYALYDTLTPKMLMETASKYLDDANYVEAVLYSDKPVQNMPE